MGTYPLWGTLSTRYQTLLCYTSSSQVYYIIRIVPAVAAAILLVFLLVVTLIVCGHVRQAPSRKKRGMYQFSEFENEGELQLR